MANSSVYIIHTIITYGCMFRTIRHPVVGEHHNKLPSGYEPFYILNVNGSGKKKLLKRESELFTSIVLQATLLEPGNVGSWE